MPDTARPARKPLTLPRSFSRVLGRLLTLPPAESLELAKQAHAAAATPEQRVLALRLRLRLLQEAREREAATGKDAAEPADTPADDTPAEAGPEPETDPEPEPEARPEPEAEPEAEPHAETPPPPAKEATLTVIDPAGDALTQMMGALGGSEGDDDFFDER